MKKTISIIGILLFFGLSGNSSYAQTKKYKIAGTHIEINEDYISIDGDITKWNKDSYYIGVPFVLTARSSAVQVSDDGDIYDDNSVDSNCLVLQSSSTLSIIVFNTGTATATIKFCDTYITSMLEKSGSLQKGPNFDHSEKSISKIYDQKKNVFDLASLRYAIVELNTTDINH